MSRNRSMKLPYKLIAEFCIRSSDDFLFMTILVSSKKHLLSSTTLLGSFNETFPTASCSFSFSVLISDLSLDRIKSLHFSSLKLSFDLSQFLLPQSNLLLNAFTIFILFTDFLDLTLILSGRTEQ